MQELWFLRMARRLDMFYKCMIFFEIPLTVIERTQNSIANDQMEITLKYPKQSYGSFARHIVSLCSR